jgi:hypothetical protein
LVHALCRPAAARAGSWKLRAAAEAANTSRAGMNSMSTHGATAVELGGRELQLASANGWTLFDL